MVNTKAVRQAIYGRLNTASVTSLLANGSASLHHSVVPSDGEFPLLVFQKQSGTPTLAFGGSHFDSQLWLVKGIVKGGSSSAAEDISAAVADRLHFAPLTITGGELMYLARESDVDFSETQDGDVYRHHGSLYRVTVQN